MKKIIIAVTLFVLSLAQSSYAQTLIPIENELILPQFMVGGGVAASRLHSVFRLKLTGLTPGATYKYSTGASANASLAVTATSPGNMYAVNNTVGYAGYIAGYSAQKSITSGRVLDSNFWVTTTPNRWGQFTTDGVGEYTGWFIVVPTGNISFAPGTNVYIYIQTNNGAGGSTYTSIFRTTSTVKMIDYSTTTPGTNAGSVLAGKSTGASEGFAFLYDTNAVGTRPLYGTFLEDDGIPQDWTTYYQQVNGFPGRWAAVIPNDNPRGVQKIELYDITGAIVGTTHNSSGIYGTVNTINPNNGSTLTSANFIDSVDAPLPVELSSFSASVLGNSVNLSWITQSELNNSGFTVERKAGGQNEWIITGTVAGIGNSNISHEYHFRDANLSAGAYQYRLKQTDFNGNFTYYNLQGDVSIGVPGKTKLAQNYPNPFNPTTKINFSIPDNSIVRLSVYDVIGKEVSLLVNGELRAGYYSFDFDGSKLTSGIYFYSLTTGGRTETKKMLLIK